MVLNTLRNLSSKEQYISENLMNILSTTKIPFWQDKIREECFDSNQIRNISELAKLVKRSGNNSQSILNEIDNTVNAVKKVSNLKLNLIKDIKDDKIKLKDIVKTLLYLFKREDKSVIVKIKEFFNRCAGNEDICTFLNRLKLSISGKEDLVKKHDFKNKPEKAYQFDCQDMIEIMLAIIDVAIKQQFGFELRETQKLTIMALLRNSGNTLAQVSTGEGKSLIVVSLAIIKAMNGQKVDIITSSHVLAERDASEYKLIYDLCGISVGHNCFEDITERKKVYSNCQVIYGELANFQRDYLLDRFYDNNVLGDRSFECVIVDEVDSMLLDKGNNVLYLAHDIPGLDKLKPIFVHIWKWLKSPIKDDEVDSIFDVASLKDNLMFEIFGRIKKENIKVLDSSFTEEYVENVWKFLVENKVITNCGKVLEKDFNNSGMNNNPSLYVSNEHISYLLKKVKEREKEFQIPNYMQSFVEEHLEEWINSAIRAMTMKNGSEYVLDVDRSGISPDRNPNIIIIDPDNGNDLLNSHWDQGLHQFLQLKHGCKLSLINLKAVFVSNVSYLKLYKTLYGLTGTLGSNRERELLKDTYIVDYITIPTAKAKDFMEEIPIMCSNKTEWINKICEKINEVVIKRSALIICETANEALYFREKFSGKQVHIYTRDYENLTVANNLPPGHIIISTNLAGRGTDIKLSKKLIEAGGLHVCLTFLPTNNRIEEQAYGRVARKGEPGTAQLILLNSNKHKLKNALEVIDLKKERDIHELLRLYDVKKYYETQIKAEENWFEKFRKSFLSIKDIQHEPEVKSILLQICLDKWAYWLENNSKDRNFVSNTNEIEKSFSNLLSDMDKFKEQKFHMWLNNISDPSHLLNLGVVFMTVMKDNKTAISFFDKIIKEEKFFSESAYYYRLYAKAADKDLNMSDILDDLEVIEKLLSERITSTILSAHHIDCIKQKLMDNILQINAFKEQQLNESKIYNIFLQSIYDILGYEITPHLFHIPEEINMYAAYSIYNELKEKNIIGQSRIQSNLQDNHLDFVVSYGLTQKEMKRFLQKYAGKEFNENNFIKCFKKSFPLPSREVLWNLLLSKDILELEEKYISVNPNKLKDFDPALSRAVQNLPKKFPQTLEDEIWLYNPEEIDHLVQDPSNQVLLFDKAMLKNLVGSEVYKFLKSEGIIFLNKKAKLRMDIDLPLGMFDSVCREDFEKLGIPSNTTIKIIEKLKETNIIKENTKVDEQHYQLIGPHFIKDVNLSMHKVYEEDVQNLLTICFAFKIALMKTRLSMKDSKRVWFDLPSHLHKHVINELKDRHIIKRPILNTKVDYKEILSDLYPKSSTKKSYNLIFSNIFKECIKRDKIIAQLIEKKCLINVSKDSNDLEYEINYENAHLKTNKLHTLDPHFQKDVPIIEMVLKRHISLRKPTNQKVLIEKLEKAGGLATKVEVPSFSLQALSAALEENKIPKSEIALFSLNGFDKLLVLEEKRYTWKMFKNIFLTTLFGIAEIVVGMAVSTFFDSHTGSMILTEGISKVTYALTCLFSGYCKSVKIATNMFSLTVSAFTNLSKNIFKSKFGEKLAGLSYQCIKENSYKIIDKLKNIFKKFTGKSETNDKCETLQSVVVKRIISSSAQSFVMNASQAAVHDLLESQKTKMEKAILDCINEEVHKKIKTHPVIKRAEELYAIVGKDESESMLTQSFSQSVKEFKNRNQFKLVEMLGVITSIIKENMSTLILEQQDKNSVQVENPLTNICKIISTAIEVIKVSKNHFTILSDIVGDMLTDVEKDIEDRLQTSCNSDDSLEICDTDFDVFKANLCKIWKKDINSLLSEHINQNILDPLLKSAEHGCMAYNSTAMSRHRRQFFVDNEQTFSKYDQIKAHYLENTKKYDFKTLKKNNTSFIDSEFGKCLFELLKKRGNSSILAEIIKNNVALDISCIQMCYIIITKLLEKKNISIPQLRISYDKDDNKQMFSIHGMHYNMSSEIISDEDYLKTIKKDRMQITDLLDIIYISYLNPSINLRDYTPEVLAIWLVNAIENDKEIQTFISDFCSDEPPKQNRISYWDHFEMKILQGFNVALDHINNNLSQHFKFPLKLVLEDFLETKRAICPETRKNSLNILRCYTIQYELIVPLMVKNSDQLVEFNITMTLNTHLSERKSPGNNIFQESSARHLEKQVNNCVAFRPQDSFVAHNNVAGDLAILTDKKCTQGSFICYEITPLNNPKYLGKRTKDHVLLNVDIEDRFNVDDCTVAGELITTRPEFHNLKINKKKSMTGKKRCNYLKLAVNEIFKTNKT